MEAATFKVSIQDLTRLVIRDCGITSGYWELGVQFQTTGLSASVNGGPNCPTLIVQAAGFQLVKMDQPTELSVDAAQVSEFPSVIPAI